MKKGILFTIAFTLIMVSCQQEESVSSPQDIEEAACKIGFVSLDHLLTEESTNGTRTEQTTENLEEQNNVSSRSSDITILHAKIARASTGCKRGFGLCDIVVIGIPIGPQSPDPPVNKGNGYNSSILKLDNNTNQYYTDLLLADTPESVGIKEMPPLIIDEDIETIYAEGDTIRMVMPQGANIYNKDLGENGGYRLYMNKMEEQR